ncbi:MAG: hypothetical protein Q7T20_09805 [Saprospiraceae bacterium]|nr:hypothetical protein [Saprospiraceae bacterium]
MKKSILCITAAFLLFSFAPMQMNASTVPDPIIATSSVAPEPTATDALVARLNEIKATDKSTLSASERRDLRKESRSIKREIKQSSGGVYLSVGAIILIVVLLIILL